METTRKARVLIARENARDGSEWYVAQVLEHDIAAQAKSINDLLLEIERTIVAHILCCEEEGLDPWAVPPAPTAYENLYIQSQQDWTLNITRGKSDAHLKQAMPDLAFRFAPGL
jgi:hypothetical protein